MNVEMLFYMETEDDDEPLFKDQWEKEMYDIIRDVSKYINTKHSIYVKNVDGEYSFEDEGKYEYKRRVK